MFCYGKGMLWEIVIMAQKSYYIWEGSVVQFGAVNLVKKCPQTLKKYCWTLQYWGVKNVAHWGSKRVGHGSKRVVQLFSYSLVIPFFDPMLVLHCLIHFFLLQFWWLYLSILTTLTYTTLQIHCNKTFSHHHLFPRIQRITLITSPLEFSADPFLFIRMNIFCKNIL